MRHPESSPLPGLLVNAFHSMQHVRSKCGLLQWHTGCHNACSHSCEESPLLSLVCCQCLIWCLGYARLSS